MQIPHQPPEDEQRQASQPLYEFSTESGAPPVPPSPEEGAGGKVPQASPAQQGLVYPPPPSFYQNMEIPNEQAPLPPTRDHEPFVPQAMGFVPPNYKEGAPSFLPVPPPMAPQAQQSRKWVWLLVAMLTGVLMLSCGLCSWAGYTLVAPSVQDATNAMNLVRNYYEDIQAKNYTNAYQYISTQGTMKGLTQEKFVQQAQERDNLYGPVLSYVPNQANIQAGSQTDLTHFTVTVNVSRSRLKYAVVLTLQKIGNEWKIVDYDRI